MAKGFCNPTNNPFKDENGKWRLTSLFYEWSSPERGEPYWTIKDRDLEVDGKVYPSLKQIYFSFDHTPGFEYEFATTVLSSWEHWTRLNKCQLRHIFAEWREELDIKLKANAVRALIKTSKEGGSSGATAAKYLAEKGYAPKRGRPSKEEIARERKIAAGVDQELESDLERIQLKVVAK